MVVREKTQTAQKNYIYTMRKMIEGQKTEQALELNIRTYEEALAVNDVQQIVYCIYCFGVLEETSGNIAKAMTYYTRSTRLSREHDIEDCLVASLNNRGNIYSVHGELHLAISKYIEALNIVQNSKDRVQERVKLLNNIGILYIEMGNLQKASEYTVEALRYVKKTDDEALMCKIYGNVTEIFLRMGQLNKAKYYNQSNYVLAKKCQIEPEIAFVKVYEALILSKEQGSWSKVQSLFEEAIRLFDKHVYFIDKCEMINLFAKECIEREQYEVAIQLLNTMLKDICNKNFRNIEITALSLLEEIYVKQNNVHKAYEVLSRLSKIKEYTYTHLKERELERVKKTTVDHEHKDDVSDEAKGYDDVKKLQKSLQILKSLSETGQHITSCISVEDLVETLYQQMGQIFTFEGFGIGLKNSQNALIDYYYYESDEGEMHRTSIPLDSQNFLMSLCVQNSKEIIIYDADNIQEEMNNNTVLNPKIYKTLSQSQNKSILFSPIIFENKTIGGITVQSEEKNIFSYVDLESLRIIASYVAIAVTNIIRAYDLTIANKKLRDASMKDALTNVFNRRELGQYMDKELANGKSDKLPVCAIMLDVDFFKQYNDNYGHVSGDQCLIEITATLRRVFRRHHYQIFRYGGDEFFVVVEKCPKEQAIQLLEKMIRSIKTLNLRHDYSGVADYVTVSVGAKLIHHVSDDYAKVFNEADQALYKVKENGRNGYHLV